MLTVSDFLSLDAVVPAIGSIVASGFSIYGLVLAKPGAKRKEIFAYCSIVIFITGLLLYYGAAQTANKRNSDEDAARIKQKYDEDAVRVERKIDTLRTLFGSDPTKSAEQVLQSIIDQAAQPQTISDLQVSKLTPLIGSLKYFLNGNVIIRFLQTDGSAGVFGYNISRAFERNGISVIRIHGFPPNATDVGVLIEVDDLNHIPDVVLKIHDALELVGISSKAVQTIKRTDDANLQDVRLKMFIAPSQ